MSRIRLTWDIGAFNPEKHYIYRSDSEISPNNLPSPIAEVGQGVNEYVDDDGIVEGETYHYFVAAEKMGLFIPTNSSVSVLASSVITWTLESSVMGFYDSLIFRGEDTEVRNVPLDQDYYGIYFGPSGSYNGSRMESKTIRYYKDVTHYSGMRLSTVSTAGTGYVGVDIDGTEVLLESNDTGSGSAGNYMDIYESDDISEVTGEVLIEIYAYRHSTQHPETYIYNIEFY